MKMITMFAQMPLFVLFVTIAVLASSLKYQVEGISGTPTPESIKRGFERNRCNLLYNIKKYGKSLHDHNKHYKAASKNIQLDQYGMMQSCSSFLCKLKYNSKFLNALVEARSKLEEFNELTSAQVNQTDFANNTRTALDELYNIKKCECGDGCVLNAKTISSRSSVLNAKPFPQDLTSILKLEWKVFESVRALGRILKKIKKLRDFQTL